MLGSRAKKTVRKKIECQEIELEWTVQARDLDSNSEFYNQTN